MSHQSPTGRIRFLCDDRRVRCDGMNPLAAFQKMQAQPFSQSSRPTSLAPDIPGSTTVRCSADGVRARGCGNPASHRAYADSCHPGDRPAVVILAAAQRREPPMTARPMDGRFGVASGPSRVPRPLSLLRRRRTLPCIHVRTERKPTACTIQSGIARGSSRCHLGAGAYWAQAPTHLGAGAYPTATYREAPLPLSDRPWRSLR
jgi:hypothetical protein